MITRKMNRKVVFFMATLSLFVSLRSLQAADNTGVVEGVVKNSSGQPVAGAFVKLKNSDPRLTFMVVSQAQGHYTADRLPSGKFTVQSVGNGFQSDWSAPVDVAAGKTAKLDLSLTAKQAAPLAAAWPSRMPEEDPSVQALPDGDGKALIASHCAICHGINEVTTSRYNREDWEQQIEEMRGNIRNAKYKDLTDEEAKVVLNYVVANFPALPKPDPNSRLPRTLMKGDSARYRVVEYELVNSKAETHDIAVDPDGVAWSNQRAGGKLSRFDPITYEYSELTPPMKKAQTARMGNLQISSNGIIWLPDGSSERRWLSYDPKAAKWGTYDFPADIRGGSGGNSMAIAPDG